MWPQLNTEFTIVNHHRGSDLQAILSIIAKQRRSIYRIGNPITNGNCKIWLTYLTLQCVLRGRDISLNPGPAIHRCTACSKTIGKIQAIHCDFCNLWNHGK